MGSLVRSVDSSLLDEWEALRDGHLTATEIAHLGDHDDGGQRELAFGAAADGSVAFTRNKHALRTAIRNAAFRRVEAVQREDFDLLDDLAEPALWDGAPSWNGDAWADATDPYFDEYDAIGTDTAARGAAYFQIVEQATSADLIAHGVPVHAAEDLTATHQPGRLWLAHQVFADPHDDRSWGFWALVDLDASDADNRLHFFVVTVGEE